MNDTLLVVILLGALVSTANLVVSHAWDWLGKHFWPPVPVQLSVVDCAHAMRIAGGTTTWLTACPSCGADHRADLVLFATNPPPSTTHWYFCPTTLDPVMAEMSVRLRTS